MSTQLSSPISASYFGMTFESLGYNWGYYGGPVEAWPAIPVSVERSWDVWSPGNGQIQGITWADLNPAPGVYNFTALDTWIAAGQAHGSQLVYTFGNAPAWAGGATPDPAAFQAFVSAIVTHSAGKISYWEGFNEYTSSLNVTPAQIVALQQVLYQTAKAIDPTSSVLSPTVADVSESSFAQFLQAGGGAYFDIAAMHGYNNQTGEGVIAPVTNFESVLNAAGLGNKPIWDTEWGMWPGISDPNAQVAFVSINLVLQSALGVQREIFYSYDASNFGIYNNATGQLTAAGVAYQQTEQWLMGATEPSGYHLNGSVYTVPLTKGGESDVIVWNSAGQSSYSAGAYTQYVDLQGQVHAIVNGVVTISNDPILLETPVTPLPPQAPLISSFSADSGVIGDGITNAKALALAGSAAAGTTVTVFDGTTQLGTAPVNASGAWNFSTNILANGVHNFTATDIDAAGITSAASSALAVTVDTVAPTAPVILGDVVNNAHVTLNGTAEANSTVALFDGTMQAGTTIANANGAWSFTTGALSNGSHGFTATAMDAAGNSSLASQPIDPIIGTVPTVIASFSPDSGTVGDGITNAKALALAGSAAAGTTVTVFDGTMQLGTTTANNSGAWNFSTNILANGVHSFTATDTDAAGITSTASSALAVTVDTQAPTPVFSSIIQNSNGTVMLKGTSEAYSAVSIYDGTNTTPLQTVTTNASGAWSVTTGKLSNSVHSFTAKAVDAAGNVGPSTGVATYGSTGNDTLKVGPGNDLVTGRGGSDTFVFGTSFGKDVITDFQAGGGHHDVLQFSHDTFSNFAAVLAHAAQVGSDVIITADAHDAVTLTNVHLSSLQKTDIHIV